MSYHSQNNCLHYWDLSSVLTIDATIALWCNAEPSMLMSLNFSTSCMDVKKVLIEQALRDELLEYEIGHLEGRNGYIVTDPSVDEALVKDRDSIRIKKDSLRRWFEGMPIKDRPAFLFDESRSLTPDGGEKSEINTNKALAIMAWLLATNGENNKYKKGDKPNATAIRDAILNRAIDSGMDTQNLKSFEKKILDALKLFESDNFDFR
jgi:hypothetical protein